MEYGRIIDHTLEPNTDHVVVIIKNQLIHVYAKPYEGNGRNILIRFTRYSMDGLVLAQASHTIASDTLV